jgi:hypothetical protein
MLNTEFQRGIDAAVAELEKLRQGIQEQRDKQWGDIADRFHASINLGIIELAIRLVRDRKTR